MDYTLKEVKNYLKQLSNEIRIFKQLRKTVYGNLGHFEEKDVEKVKSSSWDIIDFKREFRHYHIAYCLFRGRLLEEIENKSEKSRNMDKINNIKNKIQIAMEELRNDREENVRISA